MSSSSEALYMGAAYDAMRVLGFRAEQFFADVKPQAGYSGIVVGPALTTYGEVVHAHADYDALDRIRLDLYRPELFSGRPVVVLQANDTYCAHSGDITSLIYQRLGAAGFVTDGNVRDLDRIHEIGFPVFCRGANPIDALDYWALTRFGEPVRVAGLEIAMGDRMLASRDGVIRVPQAAIQSFERELAAVLEKERNVREAIVGLEDPGQLRELLTQLVDEKGRW